LCLITALFGPSACVFIGPAMTTVVTGELRCAAITRNGAANQITAVTVVTTQDTLRGGGVV
jgi:hypothetical protein